MRFVPTSTVQRLGFVAVLIATPLVLALSAFDELVLSRYLSEPATALTQVLVALAGVAVFTWAMFALSSGIRHQLTRQNEELTSLHRASIAINDDLNLDVVLQRVVDEARRITGARYSALMSGSTSGDFPLFLVSGLSRAEQEAIGERPQGKGVLGLAFREKHSIFLEDIAGHPASIGFPPNHPPMRTLLTVPIGSGDEVYGQLYLSDRLDDQPFDAADQQLVERFATLAYLAIKNATQLDRIEALAIAAERNRMAREMHDNTAQVLGYVNMKTQAASVLIESGDTESAMATLDQLRHAAKESIEELREQITGLRAADADADLWETIEKYLGRWSERSGISASMHLTEDMIMLQPADRLQVFRIVQEALTNVEKHAGAQHAWVKARLDGQQLIVDIEDDGRGFEGESESSSAGPRFGLAIMRERARAIDGEIEFASSSCGGARVRLRVPTQPAAN